MWWWWWGEKNRMNEVKYKKKGKKEGKTKRWKNNMAAQIGKEEEKKYKM